MCSCKEGKLIALNCPKELLPIAQKWVERGDSFYLGPENMFFYMGAALDYKNGENISKNIGAWYIRTNDCPYPVRLTKTQIEEIQFELYAGKLHENATLFIGRKCNLSCGMCVYHGGEDKDFWVKNYSKQCIEVPTDIVLKRLDKIKQLGVKKVLIVPNGEIFLRKDWEVIFEYVKSLRLKMFLITNGTLIDNNVAAKLQKFKNVFDDWVKVSINAHSFETWQKVSGVKNKTLYDNAVNAPELLRKSLKAEVEVIVSMVVTKDNVHEIEDFTKYWHNKKYMTDVYYAVNPNEFIDGVKGVNNNIWPHYSCANKNGGFYVVPSGHISNCCRTSYMFDDEDSFDIFKTHIDEDAEIIKDKLFKVLKDKLYMKFCLNCPTFTLLSPASQIENTAFGINCCTTKNNFMTTAPTEIKNPKTLGDKLKSELRYFLPKLFNII